MSYKTSFFLLAILNLVAVLYFTGKRIYWSNYRMPAQYPYTITDYMNATAELQATFPIDTMDVVFVGNSLTSNFLLAETFGTGVKNRGIGSNKMIDIVNRVGRIAAYKPAKIFLEGGVNDINERYSAIGVCQNMRQAVELIRRTSPHTRVYIQSTLPTCRESLPLMRGIDSINWHLKNYCDTAAITYIDVHSKLRNGAGLDSTLTWDGIHLNAKGYRIWEQTVRPYIGPDTPLTGTLTLVTADR